MTALLRSMPFRAGDPAPWFSAESNLGHVQLQTTAGRYVILAFPGPLSFGPSQDFFATLRQLAGRLDGAQFLLAIVLPDLGQMVLANIPAPPLVFHDPTARIASLYGAQGMAPDQSAPVLWPHALILDPNLHILQVVPFEVGRSCAEAIDAIIRTLPASGRHAGARLTAPVLVLPRVFEPELCRYLAGAFEQGRTSESGFMIQRDGITVSEVNHAVKRRRDLTVDEPAVVNTIRANIASRLVPAMEKAFQYRPTRMDRYIVACYEAATGGHFQPHRDNTSIGTAHRRFALTINLNPDDYDGGDLRFPEFSDVPYRAPAGAAIVFSCSLLHEVTPMRRGRRFAFLAFLYGEEDAASREQNNRQLGSGEYRYVPGSDRLFP